MQIQFVIPAFAGMTNLTASITKSAIARKFCIAAHHRLGIGRETADRARHRIAPGDAPRVHRPSSAHTLIAGRRRIAAVFIRGRRVTALARMRQSSKTVAPEANRKAAASQRCQERQAGCGSWQGIKKQADNDLSRKISSGISHPGLRAHTTQVSLKFPER